MAANLPMSIQRFELYRYDEEQQRETDELIGYSVHCAIPLAYGTQVRATVDSPTGVPAKPTAPVWFVWTEWTVAGGHVSHNWFNYEKKLYVTQAAALRTGGIIAARVAALDLTACQTADEALARLVALQKQLETEGTLPRIWTRQVSR